MQSSDLKWQKVKSGPCKGMKSVKLKEVFKVIKPKYIKLTIIPDSSVRNYNTEAVASVIADFYKLPINRLVIEGFKLRYYILENATFEINYLKDQVNFSICIPENKANIIKARLEACYPKATIKEESVKEEWDINKTRIFELKYTANDIYSIETDSKDNKPLGGLMQGVKALYEGDKAKVFAHFTPANRAFWVADYQKAMEKLRNGYDINNKNGILKFMLQLIGDFLGEVMLGISEFISTDNIHNEYKKKENKILGRVLMEQITPATKRKGGKNILETRLLVLAESNDMHRAENIGVAIGGSFKELSSSDGQELVIKEIKGKYKKMNALESIETKETPTMLKANKMSTEELGKIIQVPGRELQEKYLEIQCTKIDVPTLPQELYKIDGIPLCNIIEKGIKKLVTTTFTDYDILCTSHLAIGKQGCGKTDGIGHNMAHEFIMRGFTAIVMDFADGDSIDKIEHSLPEDYPAEKIIDLDFGNKEYPIALSLPSLKNFEANDMELESLESAEQLTDFIVKFVDDLAETKLSDRMERYLTAAGRATLGNNKNGLLDIILALSNVGYRSELLKNIVDTDVLRTMKDLQTRALDGNEDEIVQPILNRLDKLKGKMSLKHIFLQPLNVDDPLDFRKWIDNKEGGYGYFVGIRIPKAILQESTTERIAGFISALIWFATLSRIDTPKDDRKPFTWIVDEPHNIISTTGKLFDKVGVESRKYRCKVVWLAHSIEQFKDHAKAILSGGSQLTLYKTEKVSEYNIFKDQIKPFTPESLYEQLPKRWVALNKIVLKDADNVPAFIANMLPPPKVADSKIVKERKNAKELCSKKFGRHYKEVIKLIDEKEHMTDCLDSDFSIDDEDSEY